MYAVDFSHLQFMFVQHYAYLTLHQALPFMPSLGKELSTEVHPATATKNKLTAKFKLSILVGLQTRHK